MYNGTSGDVPNFLKTPGNVGAAYVTRTRDPIITNKGYPRKTAVFLPTSVPISPICSDFVRVSQPLYVHVYMRAESGLQSTPDPNQNAIGAR